MNGLVRSALVEGRGPELLASLAARPAELISAALADPEPVAARSYRHALGFDKIILVSAWPLGALRLHVWWPGQQRAREHVHDHRFTFSSVVLTGRLRTSLYQLAEDGEPTELYRETSDMADRRWRFEHAGPRRLARVLVADQPAGTAYTMSPPLLHRIEASPLLTATLFLETESTRNWSSVCVDPGAEPPAPADQTAFTPADLTDRLHRLRSTFEPA